MAQPRPPTLATDLRTSTLGPTAPPPDAPVSDTTTSTSTSTDALDALLAEIVPTRATGRAAEIFRAAARELSRNVTAWSTILAQHLPSPDGRFCTHRQCRRGGYGSLVTPHPCATRTLALIARACHEAAGG